MGNDLGTVLGYPETEHDRDNSSESDVPPPPSVSPDVKNRVAYVWDERTLLHKDSYPHVECPERQTAIKTALEDHGLETLLQPLEAREATVEELCSVHSEAYVNTVISSCEKLAKASSDRDYEVTGNFDGDTFYNQHSGPAARLAVGSLIDTCESVLNGSADNGLCIVRPPGHHAERDHAKGFCIFNNAAVAAKVVQTRHNLSRVVVLDWDVHHGNGIEHIFYDDESILYISTHLWDNGGFYPGTGDPENVGEGPGLGKNMNIPMDYGMGDNDYFRVFNDIIVPVLRSFDPEFIIVSAGFDATIKDPLGGMRVTPPAWGVLTQAILEIQPKTVLVLEGGYNLKTMPDAVAFAARTLLCGEFKGDYQALAYSYDWKLKNGMNVNQKTRLRRVLSKVKNIHAPFWPILNESVKLSETTSEHEDDGELLEMFRKLNLDESVFE